MDMMQHIWALVIVIFAGSNGSPAISSDLHYATPEACQAAADAMKAEILALDPSAKVAALCAPVDMP